MYYYKDDNGWYNKYLVEYNLDALNKFRSEVIGNCSIITHKDYTDDCTPYKLSGKNYEIRNFKKEITEDKKENFDKTRDIYHIVYDKYEYPELVTLLDEFLSGNPNVLNTLLNPKFKEYKKDFQSEIDELKEQLNIDGLSTEEKIKILINIENTIQKAIDYDKLKEQQEKLKIYYEKFKKLVSLRLVNTINVNYVYEVENFFEIPEKTLIKEKNVK